MFLKKTVKTRFVHTFVAFLIWLPNWNDGNDNRVGDSRRGEGE
mgnify:FL=1